MNESSRPKVLQIFKYYHPHTGGVEKVAQDIAEGLKAQIETRVLVCHENPRLSRETVNGIEVTRAGRLATYFSVPLAPRFPLLMRAMAREADILHFHLPFPLSDMSYLLARPHGRVVVWWHSEIVRPKNLSKLYKPFLRQFLKKAEPHRCGRSATDRRIAPSLGVQGEVPGNPHRNRRRSLPTHGSNRRKGTGDQEQVRTQNRALRRTTHLLQGPGVSDRGDGSAAGSRRRSPRRR